MYGYQDSEDLAPGGGGGKFGLNSGVFITKFEYNPNAGAGGSEGDAIDYTVQVGEREYRKRFFPVSKVYGKGNSGELTDTTTDEYKEAKAKAVSLLNGTLTDIVRVFVAEEDLKNALATPIASFKDYALVLQRLVQSNPNWNKTPVDQFLSYQWKPGQDKDKTYLEIPKDVGQGTFVVKSLGQGFKQVEDSTGIKYANADGVTHPFKRSQWYAESPYANQVVLGSTPSTDMGAGATDADW